MMLAPACKSLVQSARFGLTYAHNCLKARPTQVVHSVSGDIGEQQSADPARSAARRIVHIAAVLGLPENYTEAQLKEAYRTAVKRTRPDLGGDYEEFLWIQAAYEALTQPLSVGRILNTAQRGST